MLSLLPIYTISNNLLLKILIRNNVSKSDTNKILNFVEKQRDKVNIILKNNSIEEIITEIKKEEFYSFTPSLELSELFYEKRLSYTYEEYLEHFKETLEYESNNNYSVILNNKMAFRNIQITIHIDKWVMISKNDNPTIHFVIEHPKLCKAIENFIAPVIE